MYDICVQSFININYFIKNVQVLAPIYKGTNGIDNLNDFAISVDGLIKLKNSNDSNEDLSSNHPEDTNMPNKNNENSPNTLDDFF